MKSLFAALVVFLLVLGCTTLPPRKPSGLKPADFWLDQAARHKRLASISAKLQVRYTGRKESVSGRGRLVSQPPQRLRLELRDPLGRVQFLVVLDGEDFVADYPTQKRAYVDRQAGVAYMKKFLGFGCTFADVRSLLLGELPPSAKLVAFDDWQWNAVVGAYRAHATRGESRFTVDVDPDTAAMREVQWESGRDKARIVYGDFVKWGEEKEGRRLGLANSASIRLDQFSSRLDAEWDDVDRLEMPKPRDVYQVVVPPDVQKIVLP